MFAHADYAQHYLHSRKLYHFSLPHYLLFGEKKGNLPNPFFNPDYFRQISGGRRLAYLLCNEKLWKYPASRFFDTAWYASENRREDAEPHPFAHFWLKGFEEGRDPSPQFDIAFFKQAVMRDRPDKKAFCFELFADNKVDLPSNASRLKERRKSFLFKYQARSGAPGRRR